MSDGTKPGLILQHDTDGPPGVFGEWLEERDIAYEVLLNSRDPHPVDPTDYAWVCTLGSDESPSQPDTAGWVPSEIEFLQKCADVDVPMLGICFGGQSLAVALGGKVIESVPPEIGWFEIATEDPELIPEGPWLYFHYFAFEPPPASEVLAVSPAGATAFTLGRHLGVQFHPEATPEMVAPWAVADADKLHFAGTTIEDFTREGIENGEEAARQARKMFDAWLEWIA